MIQYINKCFYSQQMVSYLINYLNLEQMSQFQTPFKAKLKQYSQQNRRVQFQTTKRTIRNINLQTQKKQALELQFNSVINRLQQNKNDLQAIKAFQSIIYSEGIVIDSQKCLKVLHLINELVKKVQSQQFTKTKRYQTQQIKDNKIQKFKQRQQQILQVLMSALIRSIQFHEKYDKLQSKKLVFNLFNLFKKAQNEKLSLLCIKLINLICLNHKNKQNLLALNILQQLSQSRHKCYKKYIQIFLSNFFNYDNLQINNKHIQDVKNIITNLNLFDQENQNNFQLFYHFINDFNKAIGQDNNSYQYIQFVFYLLEYKKINTKMSLKIKSYWAKIIKILFSNLEILKFLDQQKQISICLSVFENLWYLNQQIQQNYKIQHQCVQSLQKFEKQQSEQQDNDLVNDNQMSFENHSNQQACNQQCKQKFKIEYMLNPQFFQSNNQLRSQIVRSFTTIFQFLNRKLILNHTLNKFQKLIFTYLQKENRYNLLEYVQLYKIVVQIKNNQQYVNQKTLDRWIDWYEITIHDRKVRIICLKNLIRFRRQGKMSYDTYFKIGQIYDKELQPQQKDHLSQYILNTLPCPTDDEIQYKQKEFNAQNLLMEERKYSSDQDEE